MIIEIADRVLKDYRWYPLLDVIVDLAGRDGSRLAFSPSQIQNYISSPWLAGAVGSRGPIAEIIRGSLRAISRAQISDAVIIRVDSIAPERGRTLDSNTIAIHPFGAINLISTPLHIIVEDETSDGAFILWMARYIGRDEIIRAYTSGRFIFRHAGGKGQFPKAASALSYGVWPREGRPIAAMKLRCGAVMDGDRRHPNHNPNGDLIEAVSQHVSFKYMLECRTIENYVPQKYFRRRLDQDGIGHLADEFFKLSEDQRRYFCLKGGYKNRDNIPRAQTLAEFSSDTNRPSEERALFAAVDAILWTKIGMGFGERLGSVFSSPVLRCDPGERSGLTPAQLIEVDAVLTDLVRHL